MNILKLMDGAYELEGWEPPPAKSEKQPLAVKPALKVRRNDKSKSGLK